MGIEGVFGVDTPEPSRPILPTLAILGRRDGGKERERERERRVGVEGGGNSDM